jgi:hypothetical protein
VMSWWSAGMLFRVILLNRVLEIFITSNCKQQSVIRCRQLVEMGVWVLRILQTEFKIQRTTHDGRLTI